MTLIEGVENEGCDGEWDNPGSLSWKNCYPSKIPPWDKAIHQVNQKKKERREECLTFFLQELLRQWPLLCNAWCRVKFWNRHRISVRYKPDTRDRGSSDPGLGEWHERPVENTGGSLQEQQVNSGFFLTSFTSFLLSRFSIAINNEFAGDFWNSFKTRIVYKFLPTLLTSTKILHRL